MIVYRELSSLERDLGIRAKTLYAVSNNIGKHYRMVKLPKKRGGCRDLSVPDEVLKSIQRRIAEVLLIHMPVSRYAKAYRFGSSTLRNAELHVGKQVVLKLDILHFFDSIRYSTVKDRVFPEEIYAEPLRILLTMLCYYRDALPQGAPSSPAITNIILYEFDELVGQWCRERGIAYTRYCDDMTFSGDFDPAEVIRFVRPELKKLGFLLNGQKTKVQRPGQQQSVTGIVVNEKLSIPADYRRRLRQELYYCQKFGIREHLQKIGPEIPEETYRMQLSGKVNYVLQFSPDDKDMLEARTWLRQSIK
ncbi:MAG: RNA-directed DNA polymerase [Oscillospiraceae bacterium]|nr:RNA-directed DNA polymerase [Oscillospiraceae bacterium]MBR7179263.1 RNA-directed DNA polymerase [Oscillospiraceae bacterium]